MASVPFEAGVRDPEPVLQEMPLLLTRSSDSLEQVRSEAGPAKRVEQWDPFDLGVYRAVDLGPTIPGAPTDADGSLTPYLVRQHDLDLRDVISRAAADRGPSVLVVLTGEPATGKTRALYEALTNHPDHSEINGWPMRRPTSASELNTYLKEGCVAPRSVIWLDEAQQFLSRSDGDEAAGLRRLLEGTSQVIVAGTMWNSHWIDLTVDGLHGDPTGASRVLLKGPRTVRVNVPDRLEPRDLQKMAADAKGDPRVIKALAAGGGDGRVVQHLTGGPELVAAYASAFPPGSSSLFRPAEHALITVALTARHLGHRAPLPGELLAAGADSYLLPEQRPGEPDWSGRALDAIGSGIRNDKTRTSIGNSLTALTAHREYAGQPDPWYEPDGFLIRYASIAQGNQRGTRILWDALALHTTDPEDLWRLGISAQRRGLYRCAAGLWHRAVAEGHTVSALCLIGLMAQTDPPALGQAARWCAAHVSTANPYGVRSLLKALCDIGEQAAAEDFAVSAAKAADLADPHDVGLLLDTLRNAGYDRAIAALLERSPATYADLSKSDVSYLLRILHECTLGPAVAELAARAAEDADVRSLSEVMLLLRILRRTGEEGAYRILAERSARLMPVGNPHGIPLMLRELHEHGADDDCRVLAERTARLTDVGDLEGLGYLLDPVDAPLPAHALDRLAQRAAAGCDLSNPRDAAFVLDKLWKAHALAAMRDLLRRNPGAQADLSDSYGIARLLGVLHELREFAGDSVAVLLDRDPASNADLTNPEGVVWLLWTLHRVKAEDQVRAFANRVASSCDPIRVAAVLETLRGTLLDRDIAFPVELAAAQADVSEPRSVAVLLTALRDARAEKAVKILAARAADEASITDPVGVADLLRSLHTVQAHGTTARLASRITAETSLNDPRGAATLLTALQEVGASAANVASDAVAQARLGDPAAAADLLDVLPWPPDEARRGLAARAAAEASLTDPAGVAPLLQRLIIHRETGAGDHVSVLLARDPVAHADPADQLGVTWLALALREAGADHAADALLCRAADAGCYEKAFEEFIDGAFPQAAAQRMRRFGRTPDGTLQPAWGWRHLSDPG